jgi:hypothetical protein
VVSQASKYDNLEGVRTNDHADAIMQMQEHGSTEHMPGCPTTISACMSRERVPFLKLSLLLLNIHSIFASQQMKGD